MDKDVIINTIQNRRDYFKRNFPKIEGVDFRKDIDFELPNTCPCCGYFTLDARCSWEICIICFWEDDGQDDVDADKVSGGSNGKYSLTDFRIEFTNKLERFKLENLKIQTDFSELDKLIYDNEKDLIKVKEKLQIVFNFFKNV